MKLTDFCLVYIIIFIPVFFFTALEEEKLYETFMSRQQFNVIADRAVYDGLENAVIREEYSGNGEYDCERTVEEVLAEMYFLYDIKTADERLSFRSFIPVIMMLEWDGYYMADLSGDKLCLSEKKPYPDEDVGDTLLSEIQRAYDAKNPGDVTEFYFPYIEDDDWYQNIKIPGMIIVFRALPLGSGENTYNRIFLSGAGIAKRTNL